MLRNLFPVTDSGVARLPRSAGYDITVVHVAPSEPDSIFLANLRELDEAGHDPPGRAVRRRARRPRRRRPVEPRARPARSATTCACGPAGLLDALEAHHGERGLPLLTERFRVATVVAGDGGTVSFARTGTTVEADGATPILDAGEDAGVLMPSGCRMGICFGCVLPLREGAVRDLRTGEITTAAPASRPAASRSRPASPPRPAPATSTTDLSPAPITDSKEITMTVLQKKAKSTRPPT